MCGACGAGAQLPSHIVPNPAPPETTTIFHGGPIYTLAGGDYGLVQALVIKGSKILFAGGLNEAEQKYSSTAAQQHSTISKATASSRDSRIFGGQHVVVTNLEDLRGDLYHRTYTGSSTNDIHSARVCS
jgi:hypothetical protein